jgi:outer membrane protein assembly factor BamA
LTREQEPDPFFPLDIRLENTYLGVQTIYDSRNDLLEPTRGLFATLDLSGSGAFVGSDFEYARAFGQLNTYRRLATWNNRPIIWAQSTRLGVARPFGGQELLRDVSFFAGGEYSVRGYDKESLGPRENLGGLVLPSGGEALVVLNEEIRFPLPADLTGLVFFDLGQVWGKLEDVDADLAKSVGFGLRVRTPVGLLRGDVAFPLDGREGEKGYRFYLGFGNVF